MSALLASGLLLGIGVFLGGCYGTLYCIGRLIDRSTMRIAAYACYALQCAVTSLIIAIAPLAAPWKLLVLTCTIGSLGVPPLTWRILAQTHQLSRGRT